jgi:hypothetical protein
MKYFQPVFFVLVLGCLFFSCGKKNAGADVSYEQDAVKIEADTTYHNGYLGFSYTVPKGWWLYDINTDNFSEDPDETADSVSLDISYTDEYNYIGLISFANLQFSTRDNHLGFDISAESVTGVGSIGEYMKYYEEYMLEPEEDASYTLLDSGRENIKGRVYEKRTFQVIKEEDDFNILTLTCPVNDGYYLTIMVNYWPDNSGAEDTIIRAVTKALSY